MAAAKKTTSAAAQAGTEASPGVHPDIRPDARPGYWAEACKQLMKKDRVMKRLIPQSGNATLQTRGDAFTTLARSIVGQQISVKAAQTVWERFALLPCSMKPANVLKLRIDDMRAAGLSARKVDYLVDLSMHFESGQLHVKDWAAMDDEAIIAE
ncbi:DNA-3-methyladenine glycosylase 2 family protein, partial [Verminephrobacter sp. Larva24]